MSSPRSATTSESLSSDESENAQARPSMPSSANFPRRTLSSTTRHRDPPSRTSSTGSGERNASHLTFSRLSQVPNQNRIQTISEFLREDSRLPVGPDNSNEPGRQTTVAMDRKRRLTNTGHDGGRRRTTQGGFHERGSSVQSSRLDGPSSPRRRHWPDRSDSMDAPHSIIDLTGSSPSATPAPVSPMPPRTSLPAPSQQDAHTAPRRRGTSSSPRRYVVPPWQPDAEVSECPVCGRGFSFLFRRHHCRKCGRVVCNDCSPHRIRIPRSLIVNPPGLDMLSSPVRSTWPASARIETIDLTGDDDSADLNHAPELYRPELEGGEKVRLCNPCVPDPQPEPQVNYAASALSMGRPQREESTFPTRFSNFLDPRAPDLVPRRAPILTHGSGSTGGSHEDFRMQPPHSSSSRNPYPPPPFNYDLMRRPMGPTLNPSASSLNSAHFPPRYDMTGMMSSSPHDRYSHMRMNTGMGPPPSSVDEFSRPRAPYSGHMRYQSLGNPGRIEAPGNRPRVRSMLDADPTFQRMVDAAMGHSSPSHAPPRPRYRESDICPVCRRLLPPRGADGDESAREAHIIDCINARDPSMAQSSPTRPYDMGRPPLPSPVQMISFVATEKDCLGEDGNMQECSICMVEYDVGDQLARLECLCKFHKECIVSWFGRKQECPLHKLT